MTDSSFNYLRTFRRRYAFTEAELAQLVGLRGHSAIAQFESGERVPSLPQAFGFSVVFAVPVQRLFPGLFSETEETVMRRVAKLLGELEENTDRRSVFKREHLESLSGRNHDEA